MRSLVHPTKNNLVLRVRPPKSKVGLVIPDQAESFDPFFEIIAIGPDVVDFSVGDVVCGPTSQFGNVAFNHYMLDSTCELEKVRCIVCEDKYIPCKIEEIE